MGSTVTDERHHVAAVSLANGISFVEDSNQLAQVFRRPNVFKVFAYTTGPASGLFSYDTTLIPGCH